MVYKKVKQYPLVCSSERCFRIGAAFFVQKTMAETSSGTKDISDMPRPNGETTPTVPERIRFINQSAWNAGISVLLLAEITCIGLSFTPQRVVMIVSQD